MNGTAGLGVDVEPSALGRKTGNAKFDGAKRARLGGFTIIVCDGTDRRDFPTTLSI